MTRPNLRFIAWLLALAYVALSGYEAVLGTLYPLGAAGHPWPSQLEKCHWEPRACSCHGKGE